MNATSVSIVSRCITAALEGLLHTPRRVPPTQRPVTSARAERRMRKRGARSVADGRRDTARP
jgi:hypothetical protein